ncbi:helix-turn-helix transcriptional regulator [Arcicella rigui]|uniref:Helix-turn-helix transcriptional regulator n=1 Tax=Arcicella rigui TaxID=797020 RepID=A0ABU5QBC2_9BACT|nr:helix-turn-helix transcriptional regulator [Arcicella rigui]MEA5139903.1 helix-turn-helix transcriptional regulator [Arcicella rigui]
MIFYKKINPPCHLQPFIECFYIWEMQLDSKEPVIVESPPSCYASVVFNYKTVYQVSSANKNFQSIPKSFITGQASKNYILKIDQSIGLIGIVFRPAALATIFGLEMYEFTDERFDLRAVMGKEIDTLQQQIEDAFSHEERIGFLVNFLNQKLLKYDCTPNRTDYAANLIIEKKGIININMLMDELYVSKRQFERQFLSKVGVSPKYYARMRRVGYLCNLLATQKWNINDWQDLVFQMGYYDQAHFIRDFTSFTGKTPSVYLKKNVELAKYLSEIS